MKEVVKVAENSIMTKNDLLKQLQTFEADLIKLENKLMTVVSIESHTTIDQLTKKVEKIEISFNKHTNTVSEEGDKSPLYKGNGFNSQREAV
jgi:SMC interacting uncharacterized protein involved in chromosome segregation